VSFMRFQEGVARWVGAAFGERVAMDPRERAFRFLEEALELVQAAGLRSSDATRLVNYVYERPVGVVAQEVGGVMVTLAALCAAFYLDLEFCALAELERAERRTDEIRARQAEKPHHIRGGPA
jgi:hypothetical protein